MQIANIVHRSPRCCSSASRSATSTSARSASRGAYESMRTGYVDETWAKEHHEYWYNDIKAGKIPAGDAGGAADAASAPPDRTRGKRRKDMTPRSIAVAVGARVLACFGVAVAKLPPPAPPTDAQKAAAEAAAKTAHAGKVGAYQQCEAENRTAAKYIAAEKAKGKTITPQVTTPCVNPGPFQTAGAAAAAPPAPAAKAAAPAPAAKK